MMEDYEAMNHKAKLATRQQILRGPNAEKAKLLQQIRVQLKNDTPEEITQFAKNIPNKDKKNKD